MSQTKKAKKDPRIDSFSRALNLSIFENFSAQVRGKVDTISKNAITVKEGKDKVKLLFDKDFPPAVIKITIGGKTGKKAEDITLAAVKTGKKVSANVALLPSGEWKAFGIAMREEVKSSK
ncbi:MAG: hypothetical protein WC565_01600 [Parcubacteria group bacterium]